MKNLTIAIFLCFASLVSLSAQQNNISITLGIGGGDGLAESTIYGLEYGRLVHQRLELFASYQQSSLSSNDRSSAGTWVTSTNTSDNPSTGLSHYYAVGGGALIHAATTARSSLYLLIGSRYVSAHRISDRGSANGILTTAALSADRQIGYEFGTGYRRYITDDFTISGRVSYLSVGGRISAILMCGMRF